MIARRTAGRRRGGATVVEAALVMSVFLLFLFGIFEYCRFLLMMHVATNAARDAARYAVVNVGRPSTFDATAFNDGVATYPSVTEYAVQKLASNDKMIVHASPTSYRNATGSVIGTAECKIEVFPCDPTQLAATPPAVAPKPGYPATVSWNSAAFGERIAVRITGTYRPALPSLLMMSASIPFEATVTMGSEG